MWDPGQYGKFGDERDRPFFDLLARVPLAEAREVVDLGCGTGHQTAVLAERWPAAHVVGVDSSAEMLARAAVHARPGRLQFVEKDLRDYHPRAPVDLLLSNATLHWVPDHRRLVPRLAAHLAPGGVLAVQVPAQHTEPSHVLAAELAAEARFAAALDGVVWQSAVLEPREYVELLCGLGLAADVWQTAYQHILRGEDAVLEWIKGTTLRPLLAALGKDLGAAYLAALAPRLRAAYPAGAAGTVFAFRRTFLVAAAG